MSDTPNGDGGCPYAAAATDASDAVQAVDPVVEQEEGGCPYAKEASEASDVVPAVDPSYGGEEEGEGGGCPYANDAYQASDSVPAVDPSYGGEEEGGGCPYATEASEASDPVPAIDPAGAQQETVGDYDDGEGGEEQGTLQPGEAAISLGDGPGEEGGSFQTTLSFEGDGGDMTTKRGSSYSYTYKETNGEVTTEGGEMEAEEEEDELTPRGGRRYSYSYLEGPDKRAEEGRRSSYAYGEGGEGPYGSNEFGARSGVTRTVTTRGGTEESGTKLSSISSKPPLGYHSSGHTGRRKMIKTVTVITTETETQRLEREAEEAKARGEPAKESSSAQVKTEETISPSRTSTYTNLLPEERTTTSVYTEKYPNSYESSTRVSSLPKSTTEYDTSYTYTPKKTYVDDIPPSLNSGSYTSVPATTTVSFTEKYPTHDMSSSLPKPKEYDTAYTYTPKQYSGGDWPFVEVEEVKVAPGETIDHAIRPYAGYSGSPLVSDPLLYTSRHEPGGYCSRCGAGPGRRITEPECKVCGIPGCRYDEKREIATPRKLAPEPSCKVCGIHGCQYDAEPRPDPRAVSAMLHALEEAKSREVPRRSVPEPDCKVCGIAGCKYDAVPRPHLPTSAKSLEYPRRQVAEPDCKVCGVPGCRYDKPIRFHPPTRFVSDEVVSMPYAYESSTKDEPPLEPSYQRSAPSTRPTSTRYDPPKVRETSRPIGSSPTYCSRCEESLGHCNLCGASTKPSPQAPRSEEFPSAASRPWYYIKTEETRGRDGASTGSRFPTSANTVTNSRPWYYINTKEERADRERAEAAKAARSRAMPSVSWSDGLGSYDVDEEGPDPGRRYHAFSSRYYGLFGGLL